jgi:DNA-directed RNA polymerase specialized sigma24 family protein
MSSEGSVTCWLHQLKAGDRTAVQKLWERYFQRLVNLARTKLRCIPRRAADEEDVALSALKSFCQAAEEDRFPRLEDRADLWQLLLVITARKAGHLLREEERQKRGGGASASGPPGMAAKQIGIEQIVSREPSPEFAAKVAEECRRLLRRLGDSGLETVALWKMEGYSNEEIPRKLGVVVRSVKRKLQRIREIWEQEITP